VLQFDFCGYYVRPVMGYFDLQKQFQELFDAEVTNTSGSLPSLL